jgi:hypothetical protein
MGHPTEPIREIEQLLLGFPEGVCRANSLAFSAILRQ